MTEKEIRVSLSKLVIFYSFALHKEGRVKTAAICTTALFLLMPAPAQADAIDDCINASSTREGIAVCTTALTGATNDMDKAIALAGRANSYNLTGDCQKGTSDWNAAKKYFPALNDEGMEACKKK